LHDYCTLLGEFDMPIHCCPLAVATGTIADWAGIVVSFLVGAALIWMGYVTNKLAKAAEETNKLATREQLAALKRDEERKKLEASLLLVGIFPDVERLEAESREYLEYFLANRRMEFAQKDSVRQQIADGVQRMPIATLAESKLRAHLLSAALAGSLVQLEASVRSAREVAFKAVSLLPIGHAGEKAAYHVQHALEAVNSLASDLSLACQEAAKELGVSAPRRRDLEEREQFRRLSLFPKPRTS